MANFVTDVPSVTYSLHDYSPSPYFKQTVFTFLISLFTFLLIGFKLTVILVIRLDFVRCFE
jgi:hypothetical protein